MFDEGLSHDEGPSILRSPPFLLAVRAPCARRQVGLVEVTGTCLTCLNKNLRSSVTITVVESVSILPAPPPILIATGNPVQLMVERVRYDGDNEVLPIGAAHYTWRSGQEDIVSVNKNTGLAVGNRAGLAEVRTAIKSLPALAAGEQAASVSVTVGLRSCMQTSEQSSLHCADIAQQLTAAPRSCFGLGPLRSPHKYQARGAHSPPYEWRSQTAA
jgi:hypothetical protein